MSAKAKSLLHQEERTLSPDGLPLPRERRFSSFARAFMSPTTSKESGPPNATTSNREQNHQPSSPQFNGLEPHSPLEPIQSREVLDLEEQLQAGPYPQESLYQTPTPSSPFGTWNPPIAALDRSASDQAMLRSNEQTPSRRASSRFDRIHWKYAKFAVLCTVVLFVTWVGTIQPLLLILALRKISFLPSDGAMYIKHRCDLLH